MGKKTFGEDLYAWGENPNGVVTQTPNETIHNGRALPMQQSKEGFQASGARWNGGSGHNFWTPEGKPDTIPVNPRPQQARGKKS